MFNPLDFTGRRFLVTGASSGIGEATAILLGRLGGQVVLAGRDLDRLSQAMAAVPGTGHSVASFDLGDTDAIPAWVAKLAADGPFHGLAHCAGLQTLRPLKSASAAFVEEMLRVNIGASLAIGRAIRQRNVAAKPASLVLISSTAGMTGQPGNVVYNATKGAIIAAVKGMALELVRDDIRVNAVAPALVRTPMSEKSMKIWSPEQLQAVLAIHPMGFGTADDVANAIVFLLSDMARWITGTTVVVDGGYTAQ
jgi:NAD(P)-dependent dehydrogenase (short-subunit alcohol dehydrogenase family)